MTLLETTASASPTKIGFVHLGCPKNLVDTETMLGLLEQAGHTIVADEADSELMLVNTCSFIDSAQKESVQQLVRLAEQGKKLVITGCLAQKFQGELLDLLPEATAVVGIDQVPNIASIVQRTQQGERVLSVQQDRQYLLADDTVRRHVTMGASVYVKIAEGCDYACGFCIIPSMRGKFRSRPVDNIIDNVRALVEKGSREIVLVGQDTTSYGKDVGSSLPQLLRQLNDIEGLHWLRFMYAYPNLVSDELLETIRDCDKVVKYLDCPMQHSHPEMLRAMRRPQTDVAEFAARARAIVPGIKLRTSVIVGYPGETEAHFQHMLDSVNTIAWDRFGVFEYSDVEGAPSQQLGQKVSKAVASARRKTLMAAQQAISYQKNQAMVAAYAPQTGQTLDILVDTVNAYGQATARTQWDAPEVDNSVQISPSKTHPVLPGDVVAVYLTGCTPYDLKAQVAAATLD